MQETNGQGLEGLDLISSRLPAWRDGRAVTAVYRLYDENDDLLYVGITTHLVRRLGNHRRRQSWGHQIHVVEWVEFGDRALAAEAEERIIQLERPRHNIVHQVKS